MIDADKLEECAAEPIHRIGAVRPAGCLLALEGDPLTVVSASENVVALFDRPAASLLGQTLTELWGEATAALIAQDVAELPAAPSRVLRRYPWGMRVLAAFLHRELGAERVVLEICLDADPAADLSDRFHSLVDVHELDGAADLTGLMSLFARRIRQLTGYDRVVVYRFDDDDSGHVAAEAKRVDLESYLGLHYPAADIPAQARRLFVLNRCRVIEDIEYTPSPIVGQALDLSGATYRAVSPVHLRYLSNMGVRSSLAISLVRKDRLWGLVACHHLSPRPVPPSLVALTHLLSQMLSVFAERQERIENAEIAARGRRRLDQILEGLDTRQGVTAALAGRLEDLQRVPDAAGIAMVMANQVRTAGDVPARPDLEALVAWLASRPERLYVTRRLGEEWPPGAALAEVAAGLIALRLDGSGSAWFLWFRPEQRKTVTWAGDPTEDLARGPDGRLRPRGSFEAWREESRGHSAPWHPGEVAAVGPLRQLVEQTAAASPAAMHLLRAATDPLLILDREARVVDWNTSVTMHLPDRFEVGEPVDRAVALTAAPPAEQLVRNAARGDVWVGEARLEGDERTFEAAVLPVTRDEGPPQIALVLRDVSERKRLEAQLQHAQRMEAIGHLTGGLAHNFNNLLAVIMGSADLALESVGPEHPAAEDLDAILTTCDDAAKIVRDLMSFARKQPPTDAEVDAVATVRKVARLLRRTLPAGIALRLDLPDEPTRVALDGHQLEQVLMNLALNARDAIRGDGRIEMRVFTSYLDGEQGRSHGLAPGRYVHVEVADTGVGIPEALTERIFDPFFTTKGAGGTGLGLSTCYGITSQNGGCITVRSVEGRGSVFCILLPVPVPRRRVDAEDVTATMPGATLLVVDDEPQVLRTLQRLLVRDDYDVILAADAGEALEVLESGERVDAMITDQVMPGLTGTELIERARALRPGMPCLLITGFAFEWPDPEQQVPLLRKPFDARQLRVALARLGASVLTSGD